MKAVVLVILLLAGIPAPMQAPEAQGRSEVVPFMDGIFYIHTRNNEIWNLDIRRHDTEKPLDERRIQLFRYDGLRLPSREVKILTLVEVEEFFKQKFLLSSEEWTKVEALLRSEQGAQ